MNESPDGLRFGPFRLDPETLELTRDGEAVRLAPQPARLLALLASRPGEMVGREEIRRHVWGDTSVEFESGLHTCIRQIRSALGDDAQKPRYVETIPRRGYRFAAPVATHPAGPPDGTPDTGPATRPSRRWPILAGALIALAFATVLLTPGRDAGQESARLVVLPFADLLTAEESPHLAVGLADEIRTELSRLGPEELTVIGRSSSEHFRDTPLDRVVSELQVTHALEGSLRRTPRGLVLSARLIDADDGSQIWADRFDVLTTPGSDPIAEIASHVTTALALELAAAGRPQAPSPMPLDARRALLEARYLFHHDQAEAAEARLRKAIEIAGASPAVHALLAEVLQSRAHDRTGGDLDEAELHARRAVELDPRETSAYRVLGHVSMARLNGHAAGRWYDEAVRVAPSDAMSRIAFGQWLMLAGRVDEAVAQFDVAIRHDPVSPLLRSDYPWSLFYANRLDRAAIEATRSLELLPASGSARACRMWVALVQADYAAVKQDLLVSFREGNAPAAMLTDLEAMTEETIVDWYLQRRLRLLQDQKSRRHSRLAVAHAMLGDEASALRELSLALDAREPDTAYFPADPRFRELRDDPAFTELVERFRTLFWSGRTDGGAPGRPQGHETSP